MSCPVLDPQPPNTLPVAHWPEGAIPEGPIWSGKTQDFPTHVARWTVWANRHHLGWKSSAEQARRFVRGLGEKGAQWVEHLEGGGALEGELSLPFIFARVQPTGAQLASKGGARQAWTSVSLRGVNTLGLGPWLSKWVRLGLQVEAGAGELRHDEWWECLSSALVGCPVAPKVIAKVTAANAALSPLPIATILGYLHHYLVEDEWAKREGGGGESKATKVAQVSESAPTVVPPPPPEFPAAGDDFFWRVEGGGKGTRGAIPDSSPSENSTPNPVPTYLQALSSMPHPHPMPPLHAPQSQSQSQSYPSGPDLRSVNYIAGTEGRGKGHGKGQGKGGGKGEGKGGG